MIKKVLVVDDERDYADLLKDILVSHDYDVSVAYGGREAIDKICQEALDLIILDIRMPKMSGYEVCQWLRNDARYKDIPILILTAGGEMEDIKAGMDCGATSYIVKPFKQEVLLALVHGLANQRPST